MSFDCVVASSDVSALLERDESCGSSRGGADGVGRRRGGCENGSAGAELHGLGGNGADGIRPGTRGNEEKPDPAAPAAFRASFAGRGQTSRSGPTSLLLPQATPLSYETLALARASDHTSDSPPRALSAASTPHRLSRLASPRLVRPRRLATSPSRTYHSLDSPLEAIHHTHLASSAPAAPDSAAPDPPAPTRAPLCPDRPRAAYALMPSDRYYGYEGEHLSQPPRPPATR